MSQPQEQLDKEKRLIALKQAYELVPGLVWQDLWSRFGGISFDPDPHVTAFKEGRRQVVNYMLGMADKLNFQDMEVLWQKARAKASK
jgi:hypothetical protein